MNISVVDPVETFCPANLQSAVNPDIKPVSLLIRNNISIPVLLFE